MPEKKEPVNFTKAYHELEEINDWFQQEDIDLEEGLKKYKRGLELIKKCRERLKETENQFIKIKEEFSNKEELKKIPEEKKLDTKDIPF